MKLTRESYVKSIYDVAELVRCALNGIKPDDELISSLDLPALFEVSKMHLLTALTAYALDMAGVKDEAFHMALSRAIRDAAMRRVERERVYAEFEKAGIWYLPLKGAILADMYPSFGVRQMADTDVLFDESYTKEVRKIMVSLGYDVKSYGRVNHDVYTRPPFFEFEMHRSLVIGSKGSEVFDYFAETEKRMILESGHKYRMTDNDFYIFMIYHEFKHYIRGGTGLRSLTDVYVFLRARGEYLDFDYIRNACEILDIVDFEAQNRRVALAVFSGEELTNEEDKHFYGQILTSGAFGHIGHMVIGRMDNYKNKKHGKLKYLKDRLFLPPYVVKEVYPFFYEHKILMPFLFFYRLGRSFTVRRKQAVSEVQVLLHYNKKHNNKEDEDNKTDPEE